MKTNTDTAIEKFLSGYNCAQSVMFAHAAEAGIDPESALKAATGFGGGIARRGEMCGALTGGILAIGFKFGRGNGQDRTATERTYEKAQALLREFERQHGSTTCRVLVDGCNFNTSGDKKKFKEQDLLHKRCVGCVKTVCETLAGLLKEDADGTIMD
jgi:C_GCAxxG_C_C family probable redox protein